MEITKLLVRNYRALKDCTFAVDKDVTVVIGKNNTGKTSLVSLLQKFLTSDRQPTFVYSDINVSIRERLFEAVNPTAGRARGDVDLDDNARGNTNEDGSPIDVGSFGIKLIVVIKYEASDSLAVIRPLLMDLDPENSEVAILFTCSPTNATFKQCASHFNAFCQSVTEPNNSGQDNAVGTMSVQRRRQLFDRFMERHFSQYFKKRAVPISYKESQQGDAQDPFSPRRTGRGLKTDEIANIIGFESIDALRGGIEQRVQRHSRQSNLCVLQEH